MLNQIVEKKKLAYGVHLFWIENPIISQKAKPGQFVIFRVHEHGERIPLTISGTDKDKFRVIVRAVGKSTYELCKLSKGEYIKDVVGPLGTPSEIKKYGKVLIIGGGVGIAAIAPIAKELIKQGNKVDVILGARSKEYIILENEFKEATNIFIVTDDGSKGEKAFPHQLMEKLLQKNKYDVAWAIGPALMMKSCSEIAKKYNLKIFVSLNSIMVDGTGMCGGCRVRIKDELKYTCVDGPEFDGRDVNWKSFLTRLSQYREEEKIAFENYLKKVGEPTWL
ncbi:dihydroorotate dehydrogenase [Thermosipho melanesiensis]|uniref:Oxidoreductase FAD/NAD(P)-binding domain protein n=2 Tax=Thermosipho melanesiensis TaxID=46541 RepID=A6LM43_THEM4|nr:sulfide/dihydroorotate dehydrogenase-like FAD/NAD-binding protein [Thermosipho melanesiensis]ABR30994.1 oxidoreductase FAD/NAD(P)-binding domain protein [Thermosipho melanesiensis BI429]APT74091.1 dihydroorotate dehydrogenase [Thermosipho melanesiensis]OOC36037.1 dihydroorotate dehydrogenase [Thermosipho melanesiensis]OOC36854.1 dihydroorotate dehydrogenase [Thermosipho melanesiensis]OOC37605.1 dihydroorotate dehydrogenase [Thermosipho melanesiensis]